MLPRGPLSLLLLGAYFLVSCSSELQDTRTAVASSATLINGEFVVVREAQQTLVAEIAKLYEKVGELDLSTKGMDASEGGLYQTFPGGKYYYKTRAEGSALYASPSRAVDEAIKRQVKFMEYVDPYLQKAGSASEFQVTAFYGVREPITIGLLSPYFDVVSRLPPGIDLNMFEWYQRGLKSTGAPVWSAQPFTDLFSGWVMDVAMPVAVGGEIKGVSVSSVDLKMVAAKFVQSRPESLFLMGADTTVVGISAKAQSLLNITALENFDYLKQTLENTFAAGKFRLTDASQPPYLQTLGKALLTGTDDIPFAINGKTYVAVRSVIAENGMVVVGLASR